MNEPETIDPRELNPLALAFVGDSVLELLVRTRLARHHRMSAGKLNVEKVKYVSARALFSSAESSGLSRFISGSGQTAATRHRTALPHGPSAR